MVTLQNKNNTDVPQIIYLKWTYSKPLSYGTWAIFTPKYIFQSSVHTKFNCIVEHRLFLGVTILFNNQSNMAQSKKNIQTIKHIHSTSKYR